MMPPRDCPITLTARIDELQGTVEVLTSGHPEIDPWVGNLAVLRVKSEMDMVLLTESELVKLVRGFADPVAARELARRSRLTAHERMTEGRERAAILGL
jgi:hypothetical protein